MSKSHLFTMSYLITNLGCEMIYVLCSRLKAQNVSNEKSQIVIKDVVKTLFNSELINKINNSQEINKHTSIKTLFDKVAHSSIMKLNSSSMSKLFDLMLMSLKLQVLRSRYPEELFKIATNHLNNLIDILKSFGENKNVEVIELVNSQLNYFESVFSSYNTWSYIILKQSLLRFFQGKNIKVSIFMNESLQSNTGVIYLPNLENAPPLVNKPGLYRCFKDEVQKDAFIELPISKYYNPSEEENRKESFTNLGRNIFLGEVKENISCIKSKNVEYGKDKTIFEKKSGIKLSKEENKHNYNNANLDKVIDSTISNLKEVSINNKQNNTTDNKDKENILSDIDEHNYINQDQYYNKDNIGDSIKYFNSESRIKNIKKVKDEFNSLSELLNNSTINKDKKVEFELNIDNDNWLKVNHNKLNKNNNILNNKNDNKIEDDDTDLLEIMDSATN